MKMGVVLWDGTERWLFPLQKVGNKKELARQIAGMNQGDLGSFQHIMENVARCFEKSTAQFETHYLCSAMVIRDRHRPL